MGTHSRVRNTWATVLGVDRGPIRVGHCITVRVGRHNDGGRRSVVYVSHPVETGAALKLPNHRR
jgi:hypothetical protein